MVRVSFSPGRDLTCRRCWISSFLIPRENGCDSFSMFQACLKTKPFRQYLNTIFKNISFRKYLKSISNDIEILYLGVLVSSSSVTDDGSCFSCCFYAFIQNIILQQTFLFFSCFSKKRLRRRCCYRFYAFHRNQKHSSN